MMNKQEVEERIAAIEREAAELRKIIEIGDKLKYVPSKLYIGIDQDGEPSIMVGKEGNVGFYYFKGSLVSETTFSFLRGSAQDCLDYHAERFNEIHAFSDVRDGFRFFLNHYEG